MATGEPIVAGKLSSRSCENLGHLLQTFRHQVDLMHEERLVRLELDTISQFALFSFCLLATISSVEANETWVKGILTSPDWASYPCKDYIITVACAATPDNANTASLPRIVNIGDTIEYTNKEGKVQRFRVEAISFYVFSKDVIEKNTVVARKGETNCFLFDSSKAYRSQNQLSSIVVKGCWPLR